MVGQQCSESSLLLAATQLLDNLSLVFGDGIFSSSSAGANSYRSSSEEIMSLEWAQTIIFLLTPFFFMLLLVETNDDDDGPPDGGMLQPLRSPAYNPI